MRKRKQWLLYVDIWLIVLTWQGSSPEEYEYWLPMGNYAFATFNLGYILLKLGNCTRSLQLFNAALPNEPKDQRPLVRRRINQAKKTCHRS